MTDTTTESFCERCGTRFALQKAAKPRRARLGRVRALTRGVTTFISNDGMPMSEAMATARNDVERDDLASTLEAFHKTFSFCMSCRQYTCPSCWNAAAGECLNCSPDQALETPPPHSEPAEGHAGQTATTPVSTASLAWPSVDLARDPDQAAEAGIDEPQPTSAGTGPLASPETAPLAAEPAELTAPAAAELAAAAVIHDVATVVAHEPDDEAAELTPADGTGPAQAAETGTGPGDLTPSELAEIERALASDRRELSVKQTTAGAEPVVEAEAKAKAAPPAEAVATEPESEPVAEAEAAAPATNAVTTAEPAVEAAAPAEAVATEPESEPVVEAEAEAATLAEAVATEPESEPVVEAAAPAEATTQAEAEQATPAEAATQAEAEPKPVAVPPAPAAPGPEAPSTIETPAMAATGRSQTRSLLRRFRPGATDSAASLPARQPAPGSTGDEPAPIGASPVGGAAATTPVPAVPPTPVEPAATPGPDPRIDTAAQPTWQIVAPDTSSPAGPTEAGRPAGSPAPSWPTNPAWPPGSAPVAPHAPTGTATPWAARLALSRPEPTASIWAASSREVLGAPAPPGQAAVPAVQACFSCGLSLSATARFCRRCGARQA